MHEQPPDLGYCVAEHALIVELDSPLLLWFSSRLATGDGAHGPREYSWVRVPIWIAWAPGRGHWLLARRSLWDPTEIAYFICAGTRRTTLTELAAVAGSSWRVDECFQQAKNEADLDQYQVRMNRPGRGGGS